MERNELLRRINTFPLAANELARDLLAGDFRSVFRGEGIEFDEVRLYEQGDDVRSIDRNVSARYGKPYVKLYREERELTVCIVMDCSASMFVGTAAAQLTRFEQAVLVSALVGFSAERSGQRFGGILFDNETRIIFKPRKSRAHIMSFISTALQAKPAARGTNLSLAIAGAGRLLKRRSIVVLVSDFLSVGWEAELGKLSEKHDCIACRIYDPMDLDFPDVGLVSIEDPETGQRISVDPGSASFRAAWLEGNAERAAFWSSACRRAGSAQIELSTAEDAVSVLKTFFNSRRR
ncbi:MAG: DUF58 domain-containing protein [Spirochaetaceae bacterium]|jgi:uncharacterized protein (DUF58 family)|nr:DUF58 domain-containing protein [Spirochaetaceae bacterium]